MTLCLFGSRIAVFSIRVLKDERIVIIAEQRPDCAEEEVSQLRTGTNRQKVIQWDCLLGHAYGECVCSDWRRVV